jgi:hypothetical protein
MALSVDDLAQHVESIPQGVLPLEALRALGIVFAGGFTKDYSCNGYPQTAGRPKDQPRFAVVLQKVLSLEKEGLSYIVKGMPLSKKLKSNFCHNRGT